MSHKTSQGGLSPLKGVWGFPPKTSMAGRAAADTLGYIVGDLPGAVATDFFYQKMMNGNKRKRITGSKAIAAASKRRRKNPVRVPAARKRTKKLVRDTSGNRAVATRVGKSVAVYNRRKPVAKLNAPTRKAIKKMIAGTEIKGTYRKVVGGYQWYGGTPSYGTTFDNKQKVEYLRVAEPFGPTNILDASAVLWHNKTPLSNGQASLADTTDNRITKIHVRDQYMITTFKNNARRTYHYKIYTIRPKRADVNLEPRGDFDLQLQKELEASIGVDAGPNVSGINLETLGVNPEFVPGWSANWKFDHVNVKLEPGQTYVHRVNGLKDTTVDMNKYFQGDVFQPVQKYNCYVMCVFYGDLIAHSSGSVGHYEDIGDASDNVFDGKGVIISQEIVQKLSMPELAGFKGTGSALGAGVQQALTQRRFAYASHTFMDSRPVGGSMVRVDDEDPTTAYDPA